MKVRYPVTRKTTDESVFFGHRVPDPFRWLEDDASKEVAEWIREQNEVTFDYLKSMPLRDGIGKRMAELWDHVRYSPPFREGEWTYYFRHDGLANHAAIYREKPGADPELFLDPNTFSEDGTTSLVNMGFSRDGGLAAYRISEGGSDWGSVRVISTDSPENILETLEGIKFSMLSWREREGFYYSRYPLPESASRLTGLTDRHELRFHRLGSRQSDDMLVFGGDSDPRRYITGVVTEDGRWLVVYAAVSTTGNDLHVQDLSRPGSPLICLAEGFDREYRVVHSEGDCLFVQTNLDAPNNRLVRIDMSDPEPGNWIDVIPERTEAMRASTGGGYLFAHYLVDALSEVEQVALDGEVVRRMELPGPGTAYGFSARPFEEEVYFVFTNYLRPAEIYAVDVSSGKTRPFRASGIDFDSSGYTSTQVFYESFDGTRIPMMVTHRRDASLDGSSPLLLSGYGGFNISRTPVFSVSAAVWLENGGICAVPNLRGGGEYGEAWHLAGTREKKQNVFDDFIAAAEYLISRGYTSAGNLAAAGGSNGGLLVGAAITQRPELFGAALPSVGVLDMLRYHLFTSGAGWAYDYGTADENEEMFMCLLDYSPLHNIEDGVCYPATLVTTADHDDRVVPAHSFKFAARLQEAQGCERPVLIRVDVRAGHGMGRPLSMLIDSEADRLAFALANLEREQGL